MSNERSISIALGGTVMRNPETVITFTDPDHPTLCPDCGHVTLYAINASVLHDEGVVDLGDGTACGSDECADED